VTPPLECRHYIAGQWRDGGDRFESRSPGGGEVVATAPVADPKTVDAAVAAARRAFVESDWSARRAADRASCLLDLADRIEREAEAIAKLVAREMGKPIRLALDREVRGAVDKLRFFAGVARVLDGDVIGASPAHILDLVLPQPVGVCALIVPWNDPVDLAVRKLGAALAAGCTTVVKPSEETPASTEAVVRLCAEVRDLPPGVVNLVHGPGTPAGEALVSHPDVDKVSFTGSTTTGRRIMELAAGRLARISLECGGKAPAVLFADCDWEKALDALVYGAFLYTGQSCTAAARLLIERPAYEPFLTALAARAEALPVGDPLSSGTLIGPLVSERQLAKVRSFLEDVQREGGRIVTGGRVEGLYVWPTIVDGLSPRSRVSQEEIFGPVLVALPFDDEEEAI
jgi:acyl-CoA reductase-like NAD-dependent aldehyde dehydrogenase